MGIEIFILISILTCFEVDNFLMFSKNNLSTELPIINNFGRNSSFIKLNELIMNSYPLIELTDPKDKT